MSPVVEDRPRLEQLRRKLEALAIPEKDLRVRRASLEAITDATGDDALHATVFVDAPSGDTWPLDAYTELRDRINDLARQAGFLLWVYVDMAATEDPDVSSAAEDSRAQQEIDDQLATENGRDNVT